MCIHFSVHFRSFLSSVDIYFPYPFIYSPVPFRIIHTTLDMQCIRWFSVWSISMTIHRWLLKDQLNSLILTKWRAENAVQNLNRAKLSIKSASQIFPGWLYVHSAYCLFQGLFYKWHLTISSFVKTFRPALSYCAVVRFFSINQQFTTNMLYKDW